MDPRPHPATLWRDSAPPRWWTSPSSDVPTYGPAVRAVSSSLGRTLLPWQSAVADITGEVRPDGRMVYPVVIAIVPRRAGKTDLVLPTAIQRVSIGKGRRAWYTAQTGGDASAQMRDEWIPRVTDDETSTLASIARAGLSNGKEGLWFPGRRSVRMFAPTRKGLHGKDSDFVCIDEVWAWSLEEGEVLDAGIRPTGATRPSRQIFYISAGGTDDSTWLLALRDLGRRLVEEGKCREAGTAYFEWHPAIDDHGEVTEDLDDPRVWAANHPAVGHTIDLDFLRSERGSLGRAVFDRAYLNVFQTSDRPRVLPELAWNAIRDPDVAPAGRLVIAFDVDEDQAHGTVWAVGRDAAGQVAAELVDRRPGTAWMPDRLADLRRRHGGLLACAADGPPSTVAADLADAGERVRTLTASERITADAELLAAVLGTGGTPLRIRPHPAADRAAAGAQKRQVGDGWLFTRTRSSGDISPIVGLSVGRHVAEHITLSRPVIRAARG